MANFGLLNGLGITIMAVIGIWLLWREHARGLRRKD